MDVDGGGEPCIGVELTETENELYDRQIRLWGLESQKRLRTAKVLVSGLSGVGAEVTKNIILSGVHSVVLHDSNLVSEEDFSSQFLAPRTSLGTSRAHASVERARKLNPMVEISADVQPLGEKGDEFFRKFNVVIISGAANAELERINNICRKYGIMFFVGDVWGTFGFSFTDLQEHTFIEDAVKHKVISKPHEKIKTETITTTVQRSVNFAPYSSLVEFDVNSPVYQKKIKRNGPALILLRILQRFRDQFNRDPSYKTLKSDWKALQQINTDISQMEAINEETLGNLFGQISPAAAVVGGVLAQEVIKAITKKEAPHCNVFLFDPDSCCGFVETVGVIL